MTYATDTLDRIAPREGTAADALLSVGDSFKADTALTLWREADAASVYNHPA